MAKNYAAQTREQNIRDILLMASDARVENVRRTAIQAVVRYNSLFPTSLTEAQFNSSVPNLVTLLNVPIPATPADLAAQSDAQLASLAEAHDLATWDYQTRAEQLYQVEEFYRKLGFANGTTAPNAIAAMRATLVTFMNYARGTRGLPALS